MEETKTPTPEPCDEQGPSGFAETVQDGNAETGRPLDADKSRKDPMLENSSPVGNPSVEKLSKQLEDVSNDIKGCQEKLSHLAGGIDELKAADQIIADLSTRYRDLNERFYEREVLLPVVYCLIRVADGCRQQIDKYEHMHAKRAAGKKAIRFIIDCRKADLVQVEQALANLGVESFEHHGCQFDPSLQKCISRIECQDRAVESHVAQHLLPGYMRNGRVTRKEYVNVYVVNNKMNNANNGGN
jgi:hypothetical protein